MKWLVSAIILASGFSKRMGTNKLLLKIGGIPVIERVITAVLKSPAGETLLVYNDEEVKITGERFDVKTVFNPLPQLGQSESIKVGISAANQKSDAYMFFVGDQPYINENIISLLIDMFYSRDYDAVFPLYNGRRGNPVIFSSRLKNELLNLKGDTGGRIILERLNEKIGRVPISDEMAGMDIDTFEDYKRILMWRMGNEK